MLRRIVEDQISPLEAVKAYHDILKKASIKPQRPLHTDSQLTEGLKSYG